jgi:hypothetical protein
VAEPEPMAVDAAVTESPVAVHEPGGAAFGRGPVLPEGPWRMRR